MDGGQSRYPVIEDEPAPRRAHRHALAFGASIAAHLAAIALIVLIAPGIERPHSQWVLAYLVVLDSGSGGAGGGATPQAAATPRARSSPPAAPHAAARPPARVSKRRRADPAGLHPRRDATSARARDDAPAMIRGTSLRDSGASPGANWRAAVAPGDGSRAGAGGPGPGARGAGAGSASARVEYGQNPAPIYPAQARRRAEQGTVALRILVAADGAVERVEIIRSSGFDSLDEAAIETVRTRWRFVPAMREGVAVESWVEVPIRFALTEASTD